MTRSGRIAVLALVGWSAFVWLTRINNAWTDTGLSTAGKLASTALALSLLGLAAVATVVVWRTRKATTLTGAEARLLEVFAGWTVLVWAVRVPQIVLADHEVGFKVVHAVLGVVSIALAVLVWRAARRAAEPAGAGGDPAVVSTPAEARR